MLKFTLKTVQPLREGQLNLKSIKREQEENNFLKIESILLEQYIANISNVIYKGTVSRDFLYPVYFINQFILVPLEMARGCFIFVCFFIVNALLKGLPGTLKTGESLL